MFLLVSDRHIGVLLRNTNKAFPYTKLSKIVWHVSPNNSVTMNHKELRLAEYLIFLPSFIERCETFLFLARQSKRSIKVMSLGFAFALKLYLNINSFMMTLDQDRKVVEKHCSYRTSQGSLVQIDA